MPFIQLPLAFDAGALAAEIEALGEGAWMPHPQGFAGNSMLPLVAIHGDPGNESFAGPMQPTAALGACPYLSRAIASLDATVGRTRLMRLSGRAEVTRHADQGYYWADRVRVHVPIVTTPGVRFECGDVAVHMAAGECWIFDTWRQHRVLNEADEMRIHLVVDTVGGAGFWQHVMRGRPLPGPVVGDWVPAMVEPGVGETVELALESVNVPAVMSPWEMHAHFALLFGDALPHPAMAEVQSQAAQLVRAWRGLWARFGEAPAGRAQFREVIDGFVAAVREPAEPLRLRNGIAWFSAMQTLVALPALGVELQQRIAAGATVADLA